MLFPLFLSPLPPPPSPSPPPPPINSIGLYHSNMEIFLKIEHFAGRSVGGSFDSSNSLADSMIKAVSNLINGQLNIDGLLRPQRL